MERIHIFYVIIFLTLGYVHPHLANKSPNYDSGNFNHTSGVYFQEIERAHFYHDRYRIITFLDLKKNLILEASFSSYCERFQFSCHNLKMYSKVYKEQHIMALNMLGINSEEDIYSSYITTLYGTFHSEDVIFYNQHIVPFPDSSTRTKSVDNQTVIVNSTFGTVFPTFSDSDDDFRLNEFYALFEQWIQEISTLTTAILFARIGKLYPELLSPIELINVLKKADQSFKNKSWPYKPEIYNYEDIINISDLRVAVINGKLIFDLLVPMLDTEDYLEPSIIYKILPFPMKLDAKNLYFFTQPRADYIALRKDNSPFMLLTEQQFQNCKKSKDFKLCLAWYPSSNSKFANTCEDSLINRKDDVFLKCPIKLIKSERTFWYKIKNNAWIFSASKDLINITCAGNMVDQLDLKNYGWVELKNSCFAESNNVFLRPHETFNKFLQINLKHRFSEVNILQDVEKYLQKLNVSLDEIVINQFGNYSHLEPESLKLLGTPLDQVNFQVKSLKNVRYQKKVLEEHEGEITTQIKNLENLKDKNEQQGKIIEELREQMKNLENLRNGQIWMWVCISILSFSVVLFLLYLMKCFQTFEVCFRKNSSFRPFRFINSGNDNCFDEVNYGEGDTALRENSFRTLL